MRKSEDPLKLAWLYVDRRDVTENQAIDIAYGQALTGKYCLDHDYGEQAGALLTLHDIVVGLSAGIVQAVWLMQKL